MKLVKLYFGFDNNRQYRIEEIQEIILAIDRFWDSLYGIGSGLQYIERPKSGAIAYEERVIERANIKVRRRNKLIAKRISYESPLEIVAMAFAAPAALASVLACIEKIKIMSLTKQKLKLEVEKMQRELYPSDRTRVGRVDRHIDILVGRRNSRFSWAMEVLRRHGKGRLRFEFSVYDERED